MSGFNLNPTAALFTPLYAACNQTASTGFSFGAPAPPTTAASEGFSFGGPPNLKSTEATVTPPAKRAKQDFGEIFNEQLKCHICFSFPKAGKHYWYRCMQGHMVCHECKEAPRPSFFRFGASSNQTVCLCSCGKPFMPEHCKLIESLLNAKKMEFKCENLTRGCQETMNEEDMIFHQSECIYRLVKCPRISCGLQMPFHELIEHMKKIGEIGRSYTSDLQMTLSCEAFNYGISPSKIEMDGKVFFVIGIQKDNIFYHWMQLLGCHNDAKNYSYTLEYKSQKSSEAILSHTNPMLSIDETSDSIIESGKCVGVSCKYFRNNFMDEDSKISFDVKIRNLKEEVKDENVESGVSDTDE